MADDLSERASIKIKEMRKMIEEQSLIIQNSSIEDDLTALQEERAMVLAITELEMAIKKKRSHLLRNKFPIGEKQKSVNVLSACVDIESQVLEDLIRLKEEESLQCKQISETVDQSLQEATAQLEKLQVHTRTLNSECAETEEVLNEYKRYQTSVLLLLDFELPEEGALDAEVSAPQKQTFEGLEGELDSVPDEVLPSADSNTIRFSDSIPDQDGESEEWKEKLTLALSDPQQLLISLPRLTERILSLIRNSGGKALEFSNAMRIKRMKEKEDQLSSIITNIENMILVERKKLLHSKVNVGVHDLLQTQEQEYEDTLLVDLKKKLANLCAFCVNRHFIAGTSDEQLCNIEYQMQLLLLKLDTIPTDILNVLKAAVTKARRERLRELQKKTELEEREKRMKRRNERAQIELKATRGRKLMPRSFLIKKEMQVSEETSDAPDDDLYEFLFTEDPEEK